MFGGRPRGEYRRDRSGRDGGQRSAGERRRRIRSAGGSSGSATSTSGAGGSTSGCNISSVSGSLDHGSTLEISGSCFGAHADHGGAAPFLAAAWDDLDSGIEGGNLYLDGTNDAAWTYETVAGRPNALGWAKKRFDASIDESIRRLGSLSLLMEGTTHTFWVSFWLRCDTLSSQVSGKFWRIYGPPETSNSIRFSTGQTDMMFRGNSDAAAEPHTSLWGSVVTFGELEWARVDVLIQDEGGAQSDDYIAAWVNGVRAFHRGSQLPSQHNEIQGSASNEQERWVQTPWSGDGHTIDFGHMIDGGSWGIDDAFVDYTQARDEIQ